MDRVDGVGLIEMVTVEQRLEGGDMQICALQAGHTAGAKVPWWEHAWRGRGMEGRSGWLRHPLWWRGVGSWGQK